MRSRTSAPIISYSTLARIFWLAVAVGTLFTLPWMG